MMVPSRLYLDTNVLVAMVEGEGAIRDLLYELFATSGEASAKSGEAERGPRLTTCELTFAEALVVPYRDERDDLITIYENVLSDTAMLETAPLEKPVFRYAAVLRSAYAGLKLPDAIHVAAAIGLKCSHLLTGDKALHRTFDLVHVRYGITKGPASVTGIAPEPETLSSIIAALREQ